MHYAALDAWILAHLANKLDITTLRKISTKVDFKAISSFVCVPELKEQKANMRMIQFGSLIQKDKNLKGFVFGSELVDVYYGLY